MFFFNVKVGKEDETTPLLSWTNDEEPFQITHYAFTTGWGSAGTWIFDTVGNFISTQIGRKWHR